MASLQLSVFSRGELQTRVGLGCPPVQYGFLSGWLLSTSHPRAEDPSALMGGEHLKRSAFPWAFYPRDPKIGLFLARNLPSR